MAYEEDETCGWPFDPACYTPPEDIDPGLLRIAKNLTVSTLRSLTLNRVGGCPVTVRPCLPTPCPSSQPFAPHLRPDGTWVNSCTCGSPRCRPSHVLRLPPPVGRVDEVKIDGVALDPGSYRVDDFRDLVRTDGQPWPTGNDMDLPDTEPGTFSVTYLPAYVPDDAAGWASSLLLGEFIKACQGGACQLSPKVTSVTRRGISAEVSQAVLSEGRTGLPVVDAWVQTWNPQMLRQRPRLYSPDLPDPRRVTQP